jgi:hypothetical protein
MSILTSFSEMTQTNITTTIDYNGIGGYTGGYATGGSLSGSGGVYTR